MADSVIRVKARAILKLGRNGKHADALEFAIDLARANPNSAPALNLAGSLHAYAAGAAWEERPPGCDEAAAALVLRHRRAAVDAYSAAARIAPNCVMTGGMHAEALANDHRFADAMRELNRVLSMTTNHEDPAVNHVMFDLTEDSGAKVRKSDAVNRAIALMGTLAARINNEIVPIQAAKLFSGDATFGQVQGRAKLLSETHPYSSRAQLLRVYVELEGARAVVDQPFRRKGLLRGVLDLISSAAVVFDSSLLIALFHANVLFVLDKFDESEGECRRALRIEEPADPNLDDIPPALSVPGADYDARVSSLKKELRVLLKQIIVVVGLCWSSIQTTQHRDSVISVRVDTLQKHYDGIDQSAAKTISDAVRFLKNQGSWSFLICPISSCDGKKFVDTGSLWIHIRSKHRDELWNKLESILGPDLNENASKDDHSLDGITLSQDSGQHDIFNLPRVQDMFESLLLSPSIGIQQAEPLVEMRRRKCREGAEILEGIKKKLRMLPKNKLSTQYEEFCFTIKNLWLKLLETCALDHREVILPLARSFQWIEMKRLIALSAKDLGRIIVGDNIDAVFGKALAAPDHQSGDNLQSEKLKPSGADETLKSDEKCEESEVRVPNSNSGTMEDKSSSDTPTDVQESVMNLPARNAEMELDKKGTSGQSVKEMASTSSCQQSLNVFNKNNADKDLSILSIIMRSLCNLRHFRDKLLTDPLVWIPSVDNPCIAQKFYEIFYSWEKNDHHLTDVVLTYMKTLICRIIDCTTFSEKICCADESYVCFARDGKDKWVIYGIETVEFLKTSALDHREAILPLAKSFQWIEMKRSIALSAKDLGRIIGSINIDAVFGKAPAAPDLQSGDNLQSEKLKASCADETLKADEKCEESENLQKNFAEGELLQEIGSKFCVNTSLIAPKIQVMVHILDFRSSSHEVDENCTIQEIICDSFCKQDLFILDPVIRFNGRNAYLDDKISFLNRTKARDCTLTINPRLRGGYPSRYLAPVLKPLSEHVSLVGDALFDIITFPQDLCFQGMDPYFVTLGLPAITFSLLLFLLLESVHCETECASRFGLQDLLYDSTFNRLLFTDTVHPVGFNQHNYGTNMFDAGSVLSSIFMFDELRVLAGVSQIHIPVGVANPHWRHPKLVELLIYDLQIGVRTFPDIALDQRKRAYFRRHVAVMTAAERLSFWLTSELHYEFLGGEQEFDRHLGITHVPPWKHNAYRSTAFAKLLAWRTYKDNLLGDQWSSARNWLNHANKHTNGQISEKQAEAFLHLLFEFLFYYVLLKITFPSMLIHWNMRPLPARRLQPQPPYLVPAVPGQQALHVSNSFALDEFLDPTGSLSV